MRSGGGLKAVEFAGGDVHPPQGVFMPHRPFGEVVAAIE
jgi:hypothetical protein